MTWKRTGLVFASDRAQMPVFSMENDKIKIFYSDRDYEGKSYGNSVECEINSQEPYKLEFSNTQKEILRSGSRGLNDNAGVMPMQLIKSKLFYIGWSLRRDVPYYNLTHVAQEKNNSYEKLGPILSPDVKDNSFSGTLHVMPFSKEVPWIGYYLSCDRWVEDEYETLQPSYDLKIAISHDLVDWTKLGRIAIAREGDEEGISGASVLKHGKNYHMWFSARSGKRFRQGNGVYTIKHAISQDGLNWTRTGNYGLRPTADLDENMCAYPSVLMQDGIIHLIYNGRSFGEGGIHHAWMELNTLNDKEMM